MTKREVSEILRGLKACASDDKHACTKCPYNGMPECIKKMNWDAAVMMETLLKMVTQLVELTKDKTAEQPVSPMQEIMRPAPAPRKTKLNAAETDFEMLDRMMGGNYYKPAGGDT